MIRSRPKRGPADKKTPEKVEERKKAQELSERTGVPLWGAFRVVRGELTLNELLKSMLRREKFQRLQKDGLDPDLAGHVASGSLPDWRAAVLQEMRTAGRSKFTRDRVEMACREKLPIAIWRFGADDWEVGGVARARTYDFDLAVDGKDDTEIVFKHDVKMVCNPDDLEPIRDARRFDKKVLQQGLAASKERKDRFRPTDEQLSKLREQAGEVRWIFRDGTAIGGRVHAFGRWDMDMFVPGDAPATLFFHALHPSTDRQIEKVL